MRVAAVFLYAFLMMPVALKIRLYTDDHTMITGNIRLSLYGISFRFPFLIQRQERFYLRIGTFRKIKVKFQLRKNKPSVRLKRRIKGWTNHILFHIDFGIGTGDACVTALCCAAMQALFSSVPFLKDHISPFYDHAGYFLQVRGIAVFRLGKLFLTAARMAFRRIAAKSAGGRANGNHPEQANQLRHADGP